jgi:hypothetical protein
VNNQPKESSDDVVESVPDASSILRESGESPDNE